MDYFKILLRTFCVSFGVVAHRFGFRSVAGCGRSVSESFILPKAVLVSVSEFAELSELNLTAGVHK